MDAVEELRGFLDNDQFVSFRWLAVFLDVKVEKSKIILENYKSSNSDVSATYCISGQLKNKQQSILVVSEKNLAKCKEMFEHINCTHIYSLQKTKLAETANVQVQLYSADVQQGIEQVALQPTCVLQLLNSNGGVRLDGNEIKPVGKRAQAIVRVISSSNQNSTVCSAERNIMKAFMSTSNSTKDNSGTAALSSSSVKDISNEETKDKSKSAATAFFAKTASVTAGKGNVAKVTKIGTANAAVSSTAGRLRKDESALNDDDDEWTEEGATSYKPDKAKLQTRKVVQNAATGEECKEVTPAVPLTVDETDVRNTKSGETKKSQLHVHGAMDDYMEDVAIEQFNAGQATDVTVPSADGRRTKRKLVEKMFGDAKGYLITEMVWEDVADDDEPLPARSSAGVKSSNSNSVPAVSKEKKLAAELDEETEIKSKAVAKGAPVAKKVKKAAPIVQQKGMMSFFGKK